MALSARARRVIVPIAAFVISLGVLSLSLLVTLIPSGNSNPAAISGSFALVDQNGKAVTERDVAGRPYLVFFGFTHCPDVCPTTLFQMSEMLKAMGEEGRNLQALFISIDPERDTREALKNYLSSFDERIVGLTGTAASVEAAVRAFRAYARKVPTNDGDYTMEHTAYVYLMDKNNRLVGTVNLKRPPEEAARDVLKQI
jgi:protein SCO1/2